MTTGWSMTWPQVGQRERPKGNCTWVIVTWLLLLFHSLFGNSVHLTCFGTSPAWSSPTLMKGKGQRCESWSDGRRSRRWSRKPFCTDPDSSSSSSSMCSLTSYQTERVTPGQSNTVINQCTFYSSSRVWNCSQVHVQTQAKSKHKIEIPTTGQKRLHFLIKP